MADLNIRKVDVTLVTRLKTEAASKGITLRAHCLAILDGNHADRQLVRDDAPRENQRTGNDAALPSVSTAKSGKNRVHPVQPLRVELGERGRLQPSPSQSHEGHRTSPFGQRFWCIDCKEYYD